VNSHDPTRVAPAMWRERTLLMFVALLVAMILASMLFWEKAQITSIPSELAGEPI